MAKQKKKKKKKQHRVFWFFIKLQIFLMVLILGGLCFYYFGGYADNTVDGITHLLQDPDILQIHKRNTRFHQSQKLNNL